MPKENTIFDRMRRGTLVPIGRTISVPDTQRGRIVDPVFRASEGTPDTKSRMRRLPRMPLIMNFSPLSVLPASGWMTILPLYRSMDASWKRAGFFESGLLRSSVMHLPNQNSQRIPEPRSRLSGTLQTKNRNENRNKGKNKSGMRSVSSMDG